MESSIEVRQNNRCLTIRNLKEDLYYKIGRAQESDVCIPAPEVSREHARLYNKDGIYIYEDISSAGSIYNDGTGDIVLRHDQITLNHGDIVKIADVEIIYRNHPISDRIGEFDDRTRYSDVTLSIEKDFIISANLRREYRNKPPITIPITKAYFTIGSGENDHLSVKDDKIAPAHCIIKTFNNRHYLESPFHQTYLNGAQVSTTPVLLHTNDTIEINAVRYKYLVNLITHTEDGKYSIITRSQKMWNVIGMIDQIAEIDLPVIIFGETGTGKELVAKAIHTASNRRRKKFVSINCANIDNNLYGSELFGHKQGAFTGAIGDRIGYFAEANHGTLFMDELVDLGASIQSKLLRAIEYNEIRALGSNTTETVDVRIIAATNRDINNPFVRRDLGFREDLYHRLSAFTIDIPPLRQRKEDIPLLMDHFLNLAKVISKKADKKYYSSEAYDEAQARDWKGNVRELCNLCLRTIFLSKTDKINLLHVIKDDFIDLSQLPENLREFLRVKKKYYIENNKFDYDLIKKELNIKRATWFNRKNDIEEFCRKYKVTEKELLDCI